MVVVSGQEAVEATTDTAAAETFSRDGGECSPRRSEATTTSARDDRRERAALPRLLALLASLHQLVEEEFLGAIHTQFPCGCGSPPRTALRACRVPCQEQESPNLSP